ncbi:Hypothetical predicted protein [Olea europaea subsp. europaea]|uniref:Uncharacterized protein n=1 Tax=Olea europaea subsp. europaea TaxID=158383 RepID=A0A8S0TE41_OLEEU|nr:Hypothetical predicted protein [Olea europaea subsp. europaea]
MAGIGPSFQTFLGSFWDTMCWPCLGCFRDTSDFHIFLVNFLDTLCRQCPGRVGIAAGMQPDFQAFLGSFWDTMCKPCLGRVLAVVGAQPDFLAFLNNFWDFMCRPCSRRIMATTGTETDFQAFFLQFLGHGVQAISRMQQECILTFRQFLGHNVQAVFGRHRAAVGMQPNFQTFLGSFWDTATSGTRPGRGRDTTLFSGISRRFVGTVCTQCLGCFPITLGTQANYQPNERSTVCRPCQGDKHVPKHSGQFLGHGDTAGMPLDFQSFMGSFGALCAGHVLDASCRLCRQCSGRVRATARMQPDFQAFVWDTVCRPCPGCGRDAA